MMRIVHISDLHLGSDPATYNAPAIGGMSGTEIDSLFMLAEAASCARASSGMAPSDPIQCVFSGDFSANGQFCQMRDALSYIEGQIRFTATTPPTGLQYHEKAHLTLGNHDIWGGTGPLRVWVSAQKRHEAAEHFMGHPSPWAWRIAKGPITPQTYLDAGSLRVRAYLLDSTLPGLMNVFAHGRVDQRQIDDLRRLVENDAATDQGRRVLRIAVLHHPVRWPWSLTMILERAPHLLSELDSMGFGMVLCGHVHTCDVRPLNSSNTMWQLVSGSATQTTLDRNWNEFLTYDVDTNGTGSTCAVQVSRFVRAAVQHTPFQRADGWFLDVRVVP